MVFVRKYQGISKSFMFGDSTAAYHRENYLYSDLDWT